MVPGIRESRVMADTSQMARIAGISAFGLDAWKMTFSRVGGGEKRNGTQAITGTLAGRDGAEG